MPVTVHPGRSRLNEQSNAGRGNPRIAVDLRASLNAPPGLQWRPKWLAMPDQHPVAGGSSPQQNDRLDSWKEIAAYLGRDVTTVQRWEKKEGLPVHRKLHHKLGSVFAYRAELDAWWQPERLTASTGEEASLPPNGSTANGGIAANASALFTADRVGAVAVGLILVLAVAGHTQGPQPRRAELGRPAEPLRVDPDAYRLVLQADFLATKRGDHRFLQQAQRLFQRALEIDPRYASAYAGLASTLILQGEWTGLLAPAAVYTPAQKLVEQALKIDPSSSDAYYGLAQIRFYFEWDWAGAEEAFKKAAELDDHSIRGRIAHANFLAAIGRLDEALTMSRETVGLAPLVPLAQQELAHALLLLGRFDEASAGYEAALRLEPSMLSARWQQAYVDLQSGAIGTGTARIEAMHALAGDQVSPTRLGQIGHMFGRFGQRDAARSVLEVLRKRSETEFVPRSALGLVLAGLGEEEQALDELERGYSQQDTFLVWLKVLPMFDPLRGHPRFDRLVEQMQFPD